MLHPLCPNEKHNHTQTSIPHRAAWDAYSVSSERSRTLGGWISSNWHPIDSLRCLDQFLVCPSHVDWARSSSTAIWYLHPMHCHSQSDGKSKSKRLWTDIETTLKHFIKRKGTNPCERKNQRIHFYQISTAGVIYSRWDRIIDSHFWGKKYTIQ